MDTGAPIIDEEAATTAGFLREAFRPARQATVGRRKCDYSTARFTSRRFVRSACSLILGACLCLFPDAVCAQEQEQELVANLAAGRVLICVAKDGIVVGAVDEPIEPGARPPLVVELGRRRIALLLGAVEWLSPASGHPPVRLDRELPHILSEAAHPRTAPEGEEARNIESLGLAFLESLRVLAGQLHRKLDLPPDEPLLELLLVDYVENYGPEVWSLRYRIAQDVLRGDYYRTRVLRPSYHQLYPPEKGQPRSLIEVRYPPGAPGPALLNLLKQDDPRLARIRGADQQAARAAERLLQGQSHKTSADDVAALLRAALDSIAGANAKLTLGVIYEEKGLSWLLAPPESPQKAEEGKPRQPGAPTLRRP